MLEINGLQGWAAGINDVGYHGLAKGSRGDWVGNGVLNETRESRRRVICIGVEGYHGLSKGSKIDLVV